MQKRLVPRKSFLLMITGLLLGVVSCAESEFSLVNNTRAEPLPAKTASPPSASLISSSQRMYHTLAAELYRQQGDDVSATLHFEQALPGNTDIALARVATETAAQTEYLEKAIFNARQWVLLDGDQIEARQYLALLLLRHKQYAKSAEQLDDIYQRLNEGGHDGLSFVASLITLESHQKDAFKAFEAYVTQYNNTAVAKLKLAEVLLDQQRYPDVMARLESLGEELTPEESVQAQTIKGKTLYQLGEASQSLALMQKLVSAPAANDATRLEYARLLMLSENDQGALEQLEIIYHNQPSNLEVLKSLVALHIAQGSYVNAEKYAKTLRENVHYKSLAHHFLAEIHESRNEMDAALKAYREVGLGEYFSSAQRRISELLVEQYSLGVAKEWLSRQRKAMQGTEQELLFWRLEAELLAKYNDFNGAAQAFQGAYHLDANNSRVNYQYAIILQSQGNVGRAESLLKELITREPSNADALNALGFMLLEKTDRVTEAAAYISKAYELRPDDMAILDSLGWLNYKQGHVDKAAEQLMNAYEKTEDPEIASHLIEVLMVQGEQQRAKALWVRMMEQYPNDEHLKSMQKKIIDI